MMTSPKKYLVVSSTMALLVGCADFAVIHPKKRESLSDITTFPHFTLAKINGCGQSMEKPNKVYDIFADYDSKSVNAPIQQTAGWNHTSNGSTTEWTRLKAPAAAFDYTDSIAKADETCEGVDSIRITLAKKINNTTHQHSNGFESGFTDQHLHFSDVESLVFDVKVNSAGTSIPSLASLNEIYGTYVSPSVINDMDNGLVNIGFTFYDGFEKTTINASTIIEIDQQRWIDQWVRITIPLKTMKFYSEINYVKTPKTFEDIAATEIAGLRVVGETKTGQVLRKKIADWSPSIPETFKEAALSIKKIELRLNP